MAFDFTPSQYGPTIETLVRDERLNELGSGSPNLEARAILDSLSVEGLFPNKIICDRRMAEACYSALWLYHDMLEESHTVSQSIPTAEGSYWHGVMHRREPDYSNAKYWFGRVGDHPLFLEMYKEAANLVGKRTYSSVFTAFMRKHTWDPVVFVDVCAEHYRKGGEAEALCRKLQLLEWRMLFDYCYRRAVE